jgi:Phage virion morphogenesis family.
MRIRSIPPPGVITAAVDAVRAGLSDFAPLFERLADRFYSDQRGLFASGGASAGAPWDPLADQYAKWKDQNFPGRRILERTGAMAAASTDASGRAIADRRMEIDIAALPYAGFHHTGTRYMPQRDFFALTARTTDGWDDDTGRFIDNVVRDAARGAGA